MAIATLIELLQTVEADATVPFTKYLLDGEYDDMSPAVQAVADYCEGAFVGRADIPALNAAGYSILSGVDCFCISTKKGIVNTGSDYL